MTLSPVEAMPVSGNTLTPDLCITGSARYQDVASAADVAHIAMMVSLPGWHMCGCMTIYPGLLHSAANTNSSSPTAASAAAATACTATTAPAGAALATAAAPTSSTAPRVAATFPAGMQATSHLRKLETASLECDTPNGTPGVLPASQTKGTAPLLTCCVRLADLDGGLKSGPPCPRQMSKQAKNPAPHTCQYRLVVERVESRRAAASPALHVLAAPSRGSRGGRTPHSAGRTFLQQMAHSTFTPQYADFGPISSTCQGQHRFPASSCKSRAGNALSPRTAEPATTSGRSRLAQSSSRMRWLRPLSGSRWPSRTNILTGGGSCVVPNMWSHEGRYAQNSSKATICTFGWHSYGLRQCRSPHSRSPLLRLARRSTGPWQWFCLQKPPNSAAG